MLSGDEGQRQAYLAALGIPLWAARQALPHALATEPLGFVPFVAEFADEPTLAAAPSVVEDVPAAIAPAAAELREPPARPQTAPPPPRAPQAVAVPRPSANKTTGDFPRFNFWLKTLPGWQLIIELGEVPDLSGQEHMLLGQIEAVLGGAGLQAPTTFRWPLSANPAIARDPQSAREAVQFFLKRGRQPDSRYLLLGRDLLPFVEGAMPADSLALGDSLAWLLAEPARKRALWQSLMSLLS